MDPSRFTDKRTGRLVKISAPEEDWAFIPASFPPTWPFPVRLWPLLTKAKEELARLDGIGRTLSNPQLLLHPIQHREALRSSSLEGTYASPEELLLFELKPRRPKPESDKRDAVWEVFNYSEALRKGLVLLNSLPLSLRFIKVLHQTLLEGIRGKGRVPGEFRNYQVHVGSDRRFIPPPPNVLGACLDDFEKAMNTEDSPYDPLVWAFLLHYQFEAIHPFRDGNGRIGRLLLALMIFQQCGLTSPWLYMSAFFERYRDEYINNLFRISTHGDWETWIEFCLKGTAVQAVDTIRRCEDLRALKERFHQLADGLSTRSHRIIDRLFDSPVLTVPMLVRDLEVTYPTAKSDVHKLVSKQILKGIDGTYPKHYLSPEILRIAFRELGGAASQLAIWK